MSSYLGLQHQKFPSATFVIHVEASPGITVVGATLCLACSNARAAGLTGWLGPLCSSGVGWDCSTRIDNLREEGVLWAVYCRHLPRWPEVGLRKLEEPPFAGQAGKSGTAAGLTVSV